MASHHSYKATVTKLPKTSEVEIKSEISAKEFAEAIKNTLENIKKDITLPGFRKGTAPEKIIREKIGEAALITEAAEHAISHAYGHILEAEKIDAIGHPKVAITKIAEGNPLEFTITTAVLPVIEKFNYKEIATKENAKKIETVSVTDEELSKTIETIQKNYGRMKQDQVAKEKGASEKTGNEEGKKDDKLPPLTDEMVKTWGEFKDVADFKEKLKQNMIQEKEQRGREKKRLELIEALTANLDVVVPEVLIESELGRMSEQMKHDIERMGLKFEDYLKHLKKSEADLKKEWRADAAKRVKLDLAIAHIAKEEKITADKDKVETELKHAEEHHKDINVDRARAYFAHVFINQAVFDYLEKQK